MKQLATVLLLTTLSFQVHARQKFIVFYSDKGHLPVGYNQQPPASLSQTAQEKRIKEEIGVDYYDMPVAVAYNSSLEAAGVKVLRCSKWLNAALVETDLSAAALQAIQPAIVKVVVADWGQQTPTSEDKTFINIAPPPPYTPALAKTSAIDYGLATPHNQLLNIGCLHDMGYTGKGVSIAFLDAGFSGMDTISHLYNFRSHNRLLATYDFWDGAANVYHKSNHGTYVANYILSDKPGVFVGTAYEASAAFALTENVNTETLQDEFYFVAGLEWADSLGVDIVSASLSYKNFDNALHNYKYSDMDGKTAISTRGCRIAAAKGLLVVNGIGNSGFLGAPSDADSVLSVGGSNNNGVYDQISSYGPAYDGRVKPDVAAQTISIYGIGDDGKDVFMNYGGTSSSTPMVAGLAACLKQAYPAATNVQLIQAIRKSGSRASNPDKYIGYGVPDACKAKDILGQILNTETVRANDVALQLFPNPAYNMLYLQCGAVLKSISILSVTGRVEKMMSADQTAVSMDISNLPPGTYFAAVTLKNGQSKVLEFIKQ